MTARFVTLLVQHIFAHERLEGLAGHWENLPLAAASDDEPVPPEQTLQGDDRPTENAIEDSATTSRGLFYPLVNRCDIMINAQQVVTLTFDLSHRTDPNAVRLELTQAPLLNLLRILHQKFLMAGWATSGWPQDSGHEHSQPLDMRTLMVH